MYSKGTCVHTLCLIFIDFLRDGRCSPLNTLRCTANSPRNNRKGSSILRPQVSDVLCIFVNSSPSWVLRGCLFHNQKSLTIAISEWFVTLMNCKKNKKKSEKYIVSSIFVFTRNTNHDAAHTFELSWIEDFTQVVNTNGRLNIQTSNGQVIHKNRTLTQTLLQPAQETKRLSTVISPGNQPAINQTCSKSDSCI